MKHTHKVIVVVVALLLAFGGGRSIWAAQLPGQSSTLVSHADVTLTAAASAVQVLAANANRIAAHCENTGGTNSARIGDATTDATHGLSLASGAEIPLGVTTAIYAFSTSGTTINCSEVVSP